MKLDGEPMTLVDVETILSRASAISNHRRFVIAGSLAATGAVVNAPLQMVMSRDLDFYPQLDPGRGFEEIAREIGLGSAFHIEHGFYADPISPKILALPHDWEKRLAPISLANHVVAFFIDPNDVAVSKLVRGNDNDIRWATAGLQEGLLNLDVMRDRLTNVENSEAHEIATARHRLQEIEQGLAKDHEENDAAAHGGGGLAPAEN